MTVESNKRKQEASGLPIAKRMCPLNLMKEIKAAAYKSSAYPVDEKWRHEEENLQSGAVLIPAFVLTQSKSAAPVLSHDILWRYSKEGTPFLQVKSFANVWLQRLGLEIATSAGVNFKHVGMKLCHDLARGPELEDAAAQAAEFSLQRIKEMGAETGQVSLRSMPVQLQVRSSRGLAEYIPTTYSLSHF
jgi:hypothetical protein